MGGRWRESTGYRESSEEAMAGQAGIGDVHGSDSDWSDSGCVLQAETAGLVLVFKMECKRKRIKETTGSWPEPWKDGAGTGRGRLTEERMEVKLQLKDAHSMQHQDWQHGEG